MARLEVIKLFLAYAEFKGFILYQMNTKCAFINGFILEEVYVEQPSIFEYEKFLKSCFHINEDFIYGLKQAPRAWYKRLGSFLLENGFKKRKG